MSERSRASGRSGSHCAERKGYRHLDKMYRALTFLCTRVYFFTVFMKLRFLSSCVKTKRKRIYISNTSPTLAILKPWSVTVLLSGLVGSITGLVWLKWMKIILLLSVAEISWNLARLSMMKG